MRRRDRVPGCLFIGSGRYWWRVKLPGETELKARPLVPGGGSYATNDPGVAEQVARDMYARATCGPPETILLLNEAAAAGSAAGNRARANRRVTLPSPCGIRA